MAKQKRASHRRSTTPNPDLTIQARQQQVIAARAAGDRMLELGALAELGHAYAMQRDYRRAMETHALQLAIAREVGDRNMEALALGAIGVAHVASSTMHY
ncbi:MAG: hypothetical protein U0X20_15530 [Caldilineaceae bacterium]